MTWCWEFGARSHHNWCLLSPLPVCSSVTAKHLQSKQNSLTGEKHSLLYTGGPRKKFTMINVYFTGFKVYLGQNAKKQIVIWDQIELEMSFNITSVCISSAWITYITITRELGKLLGLCVVLGVLLSILGETFSVSDLFLLYCYGLSVSCSSQSKTLFWHADLIYINIL